jgi:hypothetical protein
MYSNYVQICSQNCVFWSISPDLPSLQSIPASYNYHSILYFYLGGLF